MAQLIYRLSQLHNRPAQSEKRTKSGKLKPAKPERHGLFGVGRTKLLEDFIFHSAADPLIPGTDVERIHTIPLGAKAVGVPSSEVERVSHGLQRCARTRIKRNGVSTTHRTTTEEAHRLSERRP
jgi:hypothetical protein